MNSLKFLLIAIAVSLVITSCKSSKDSVSSRPKLTDVQQIELTYIYIDACKEKLLGNLVIASTLFEKCIKVDPSNDAAWFELANIYVSQKRYPEAEKAVSNAILINKKNEWYHLLLAEIYKGTKQYKKAASVYEDLVKLAPNKPDYYEEWAMLLVYSQNYAEAVKIFSKIEDTFGFSEETSTRKLQIYQSMGKYDLAITELNKLLNHSPQNTDFLGMMAEMYMVKNDKPKAFEIYQKILAIDSTNARVHLSLSDYYRADGQNEKAFSEMKIAFKCEELSLDSKVQILMTYYTVTEKYPELKQQAYELIGLMLENYPDEAKVHSVFGDFLYRDKKLKQARDEYRIVTEKAPDKFPVWQQLLYIDSELVDFTALNNDSDKAMELFPTQSLVYLMNGIAKINLTKYQEALNVLIKGKDYVMLNDKLLVEFYSYIGECQYNLKNLKEAFNSYEQVLKLDQKNALVLNNYSYYLSLGSDSLPKAERMSEKANDISPNNPSYEDTYAWVLYKTGKYKQALEWIEKAIVHGGFNNDVIVEHKGDILYQLGKHADALTYWKQARTFGKGSDLLDKKIKEEKLVE